MISLSKKIDTRVLCPCDGIFGNCFNEGFSPLMRNLVVLEDCTLKDISGIRFSVT